MNSTPVESRQVSIHDHLERLVQKHEATSYLRPIPDFSRRVADEIVNFIEQTPTYKIILDSCCGTGESTASLAAQFPSAIVIGLDKSTHRTKKHIASNASNYRIWRADVEDLWRLLGAYVHESSRIFDQHYLFYPNPYPKPHHILRRWHGHPLFPEMMRLAPQMELRTNWDIYANEFTHASLMLGYEAICTTYSPATPITTFERKYAASGHTLYKVRTSVMVHSTIPLATPAKEH
jgi:tRNA (guanine-N7-)-methyltransferase